MDIHQRQMIEHVCCNLVIALAQHGDHHEDKQATELFTEYGVWVRGGKDRTGHAEILESYKEMQGSNSVTRHGVLGTNVTVIDEDHASAVTYYVAFRHDAPSSEVKLPVPLETPFSMGEWHDSFTRTPVGWRISRRATKRVFQRLA